MGFASGKKMPHDGNGKPIPVALWGTMQAVSFDGSVATGNAVATTTKVVRLCATQDCYVLFGASPTAAANTSILLPKGVVEYVEITGGHKVAAIKVATAGILNVVECA
jgi:hypothetical protein